MTCNRDCGEAIGYVAKSAGCSVVTTYCGHGVGRMFHTAPNIPHYPNNKAKGTMKVGVGFFAEIVFYQILSILVLSISAGACVHDRANDKLGTVS